MDETFEVVQQKIDNIVNEINIYKILLKDSDYKATKHSEGLFSEEEYAPIKTERQQWRDKINELEIEMEKLINNE